MAHLPVEAMLRDWEPLLAGRDPLEIAAITEDIQSRSPGKEGPSSAPP